VDSHALVEDGHTSLTHYRTNFDELVRYLNSVGGASGIDDQDTTIPCYALPLRWTWRRLAVSAHSEACDELNDANARTC